MTQPVFTTWFHEQAAIQHQVEHVLFPDVHKRHDPNAALQAANFYNQMARDFMRHHGKSKPQQLLTQALLAITGFAVTNHPMTALQVAQETNVLEITENPGTMVVIGMLIPELKKQSAERLEDNSEWQNILNFEGDTDELLKLCREKAFTERSSMLDSTLRWAVAAVKTRQDNQGTNHTPVTSHRPA